MKKNRASVRRTFVLEMCTAALLFLLVSVVLLSLGMHHGAAVYHFDGHMKRATAFPFLVETESEYLTVTAGFRLHALHATTFVLSPDDCIESLTVNGVDLPDAKGKCHGVPGYRMKLPMVHAGANTLSVRLHDFGGLGGFSMRASWLDPLVLFFLIVWSSLLLWISSRILFRFTSSWEMRVMPTILLFALLLRLGLSWHGGFGADIHLNQQWGKSAAILGPAQSYTEQLKDVPEPNYPPLTILIFGMTARSYQMLFSPEMDTDLPLFHLMIKLPAIFADLATIVLLFFLILPLAGKRGAFAGALIYALHPAVFHNSAIWGQTDALFTMFLCATILAMQRKHWIVAGMTTALALLLKMQAIILLPILFVAMLPSMKRWISVTLGGLSAAAVVLLPFIFGNALDSVWNIYAHSVGYYSSMSSNAFNFWWMLFRDGSGGPDNVPLLGILTARDIGILIWGAIILSAMIFLGRAIHEDLKKGGALGVTMLAAALIAYGFSVFSTEMHERYLFPYMALALPLVFIGGRGILLYGASSLLFLGNLTLIVAFTNTDRWLVQDLAPEAVKFCISTYQVLVFVLTFIYVFHYAKTQLKIPLIPFEKKRRKMRK